MNAHLWKALIVVWALCALGLAQEEGNVVPEVPNDEDAPPEVLFKDLSFLHKYNDTRNGTHEVSTNFTLPGGLSNRIQNLGGVQKTILNNRIQYNFYFWLLPKDFNATEWGAEKTEK